MTKDLEKITARLNALEDILAEMMALVASRDPSLERTIRQKLDAAIEQWNDDGFPEEKAAVDEIRGDFMRKLPA